jgi:hypothetical protein
LSTEALHQLEELTLGQILRALEHQMLEQMRKASAIFGFETKADVVVHAHCRYRHRTIFGQHHAQTVAQGVIVDRYL